LPGLSLFSRSTGPESEAARSRSFSLLYPKTVVHTPAVKKLVGFLVAEAKRLAS